MFIKDFAKPTGYAVGLGIVELLTWIGCDPNKDAFRRAALLWGDSPGTLLAAKLSLSLFKEKGPSSLFTKCAVGYVAASLLAKAIVQLNPNSSTAFVRASRQADHFFRIASKLANLAGAIFLFTPSPSNIKKAINMFEIVILGYLLFQDGSDVVSAFKEGKPVHLNRHHGAAAKSDG